MRLIIRSGCLALLAGVAIGAEVKVLNSAGSVPVSVVRRVELGYQLLTQEKQLEFEVDGPAWLRVYTRLWWPVGATGRQVYKLMLVQDEMEREESFEVGVSGSSYGPGGRQLAQWRSFFVQVPPGRNRYRLRIASAPSETVGVRLALRAPRPWEPIELAGLPVLELSRTDGAARYWKVLPRNPVRVSVKGPGQVRIRTRLNYDAGITGRQGLVLVVTRGGQEMLRQGFQVWRSDLATWRNESSLVPSSERRVVVTLPEGSHDLSVMVTGTLAKSAALALDFLPAEKYE